MANLGSDGRRFVGIAELLSKATSSEEMFGYFEKLKRVASQDGEKARYCTRANLLSLLLHYTLPTVTSSRELFLLVQVSCDGERDEGEEFGASVLEELDGVMVERTQIARESDEVVATVAESLLEDTSARNRDYDFSLDVEDGHKDIMFKFLRAKIVFSSPYLDSFAYFDDFFQYLDSHEPFEAWRNGIIKPYTYYWDHYGRLDQDGFVVFEEFAQTKSIFSVIEVLIEPLNLPQFNKTLEVSKWIKNVIFPVLAHFGNNFQPLLHWLYSPQKWKSRNHLGIFQVAREVFLAASNNPEVKQSNYLDLVRYYVAACYYYSLQFEKNASSIEITQVYDLVSSTLLSIGISECSADKYFIDSFEATESFDRFIDDSKSPINPLISSGMESAGILLSIVNTCSVLYPINKVTISQYLKLKFSDTLSGLDKEIEVAKILSGLTETNHAQLLRAVNLYVSTFLDSSDECVTNVQKLIVEKCLSAKLFDLVSELHSSQQLSLTSDTYFELVFNTFWSFYNSADTLNENSGNLAASKECLLIMDTLSRNGSLHEKYNREILGIKHLFKAITNMKNFKIVVSSGKNLVPGMLLSHFGDLEGLEGYNSSPLTLVTKILEQNSKAYYAFEKLFKIVNDLLIYFENTRSRKLDAQIYFTKLKSACIESALLDNNFNFAYTQSMELIEYYVDKKTDVNDLWLTFYQVGKYVSPTWFDDPYSNRKVDILSKQRSVLALTLKVTTSVDSSINTSKIILNQWESINQQIKDWYDHWNTTGDEGTISGLDLQSNLSQNLSSIANDLIDDASKSTNQASEKLSGLLVSGLGWAIGASK